jgi:hypothetical protein
VRERGHSQSRGDKDYLLLPPLELSLEVAPEEGLEDGAVDGEAGGVAPASLEDEPESLAPSDLAGEEAVGVELLRA